MELTTLPDVFLTTMKPQQMVVTAQDVESSLYYLHFDSADDEEIRGALQAQREAKRLSGIGEDERRHSSESSGLKRKPLPASPHLAMGNRPGPPPKVYPDFQIPDYQLREPSKFTRKPLPSPTREPSVQDDTPQLPPRKPLGPRLLHSRNISTDTTATVESVVDYPVQNEGKQSGDEERMPDFSITIIRRDPTSGGQWNVGKLTGGAAAMRRKNAFSSSGLQSPQAENSVAIEISTEGYSKFIDHSVSLPTPGHTQNHQHTSNPDTPKAEKSLFFATKRFAFRRQLLLEKPRSHSTSLSPRKKGFRSSIDSRSSEWSAAPEPSVPSPPLSLPLFRPYTFQSPWNGICEFSTGMSGRSVKCKHTLPSPANSAGQHSAHSTFTISELRFNLPTSNLFTKTSTSPKRPPLPTSSSHRSSFLSSSQAHSRSQSLDGRNPGVRQRNDSSFGGSEDELVEWMDLSLVR